MISAKYKQAHHAYADQPIDFKIALEHATCVFAAGAGDPPEPASVLFATTWPSLLLGGDVLELIVLCKGAFAASEQIFEAD